MKNVWDYFRQAPCTGIIILVNVGIFFALTMFGATEDITYMMDRGIMHMPYFLEDGINYRIFTSMFLHFGFEHLMSNMIMLGALGWQLEVAIGKIRYLLIYIVGGLCGQFAMIWYSLKLHEYTSFAGASGAIFAVAGALLVIVLLQPGQTGTLPKGGLLLAIGLSLAYGFTSDRVANPVHVGSLIGGLLLGLLLQGKADGKGGARTSF